MQDASVRPRRRRLRFAFAMGFAIASVSIIVLGMEFLRSRNARFEEEVRRRGGMTSRKASAPSWLAGESLKPLAQWLEPILPAGVSVFERDSDAERVRELARVRELESLWLYDPAIAESDLALLAGLRQVTHFMVSGRQFTDRSIDFLPPLPQMQTLRFWDTSLTNACLPRLKTYADGVLSKPLDVDLMYTNVNLARDLTAKIPSEVVVNEPFSISAEFRLDIPPPAASTIESGTHIRQYRDDLRRPVEIQSWGSLLPVSSTGKVQINKAIAIPVAGEADLCISLADVPYHNLKVTCTIARKRIRVIAPKVPSTR